MWNLCQAAFYYDLTQWAFQPSSRRVRCSKKRASFFLEVFTKLARNEASLTVREAIIGRELQSTRIPRVIGEVDEEAAGFLALGSKKNRGFWSGKNAFKKRREPRKIDRSRSIMIKWEKIEARTFLAEASSRFEATLRDLR